MSKKLRNLGLVGSLIAVLLVSATQALPAHAADPFECLAETEIDLSVNPTNILHGQTTTVRWSVSSTCTNLTQRITGIGPVATHGSQVVQPAGTSSYTMTVRNSLGSKQSAPATVTLPGGDSFVTVLTSQSLQVRSWELGINGGLWGQRIVAPLSPGRTVLGSGDFDGDSDSDILMRESNGDVWVGLMQNRVMLSQVFKGNNPGATVGSVADLNRDGVDDILWLQPPAQPSGERTIIVWLGGNHFHSRQISHSNLGLGVGDDYRLVGVGNFDGIGWLDLMWDAAGTATVWRIFDSAWIGDTVTGTLPASVGRRSQGIGDFNGDGRPDVLWRDAANRLSIWIDGRGDLALNLGWHNLPGHTLEPEWLVKGLADVNHDGHTDVIFHRPSDGHLAVWMVRSAAYLHDAYPGTTTTSNFETILPKA